MKVCFTEEGWNDYQHWVQNDRDVLEKINLLIHDVRRNFFKGLGKPEPLKGDLRGWWSRRIKLDHRLVYAIAGSGEDRRIIIAACRYHYGD